MGLKSLLRLQRSERPVRNPESRLQPAPIVMVNSIHDAFSKQHSLHTEGDPSIIEVAPQLPRLPKCSIQCIIETDEIESLVDVKYQMMAHSIYQQQRINKWTLSLGGPSQGVVLRGSGHRYFSAPEELGQTAMPLVRACERLNVTAAISMCTPITTALASWSSGSAIVYKPTSLESLGIQWLQTLNDLPLVRGDATAALIVDTGTLLVWSYEHNHRHVLAPVYALENRLIDFMARHC